jgi:putative transposase
MAAMDQLTPIAGVKRACQALAVPRASWYRRRRFQRSPLAGPSEKGQRHSARALSESEQSTVLACLHEERFQDCSPAQVYAALLDQGRYHCSIRTMYRLLEAGGQSRERRDQLTHPPYQKPELLATEANQLWSWDITKLRGPVKWTAYHLYVILDVFSRYVVGWMIAYRESAVLAKRLIEYTCLKQNIAPGQLTVHADRGSSMKSKPVALLLADLGVVKTHSRPHVSDDNPYSESQFRTLQIPPRLPGSLRFHRRRSRFLPILLPVVQPPAPPLWPWSDDAGHGPPRPGRSHLGSSPGGPGRRLPSASRTLRPKTTPTTRATLPGLDQPAAFGGKNSLNFYAVCLILVDTHRKRDEFRC